MPNGISRRKFLKQSGRTAVGGALLASSAKIARGAPGANGKVRLAFIGCGNRRKRQIPAFIYHPNAQIAAVCDVNSARAQQASMLVQGYGARQPDIYTDYRRILERKDIDAVVIATPEHWKCLPTIQACQAGKHVYVEKPLALTIGEGQLMVKAARKYNRIAMVGTQQRSVQCYREAVEFIQSGQLGKISEAHCWNFENRAPIGYGNPPDSEPPGHLDWDMWLGPAPKVPYNHNRCNRFHFFKDYGNGWQVDWAVHMYDVVHWAMQVDHPISVFASGGKFARRDNTEHPDTFEAVLKYPDFVAVYSYRHGNGRGYDGMWYGNAFFGEKGTLLINREGWRVIPERVEAHDFKAKKGYRMAAKRYPGTPVEGPHQHKFIENILADKQPDTGDIETGHNSTIPGHLSNISYWTGRKVYWDADKGQIKDDPEANEMLIREYRKPWKLEV